ncbi:helix-turn-helix domain-containing protein [Streptomyces sp. NPDC059479]|uniref:helix-turn-helix domain-containing protein n=1 Tax=Streptomyces sp. NPDC059479 TaxID=3346848 RepID=UPI0036885826
MSLSPLSTAQTARKALAERLRELRKDAELTGRELGVRCGWSESKSSRIEGARTAPSDADIRAWCAACGAADQAPDLVAANRTAESMYIQWKRRHRTGMRRAQAELLPLYERTRTFRIYCSNVVPGLLQTPPYATALMRMITDFQGTPDDLTDAVATRMERARVLHQGEHTFAVLLEEAVLGHRLGNAEVMAGQLGHLFSVLSLPALSLGIIPAAAERTIWPLEAFYLFDDRLVSVETLTAEVNVTAPSEAHDYIRAFAELSKSAVFGAPARTLINDAMRAFR